MEAEGTTDSADLQQGLDKPVFWSSEVEGDCEILPNSDTKLLIQPDDKTEEMTFGELDDVERGSSDKQQYRITRAGDDRAVAVYRSAQDSNSSDNHTLVTKAFHNDPWYHRFKDPRELILRHFDGDSFAIPWVVSAKWKVCLSMTLHTGIGLTLACSSQ